MIKRAKTHFLYFLLSAVAVSSFAEFIGSTSIFCYAANQASVWNLSRENAFFVGREDYLQKIETFFKGEKNILALTGGPGFGKSQIAKKYAQQFHKNYDFVWWFDVQQDIPSQFERLTIALNTLLPEKERVIPSTMSKEALIDIVKNILRIKKIRYLLIFDNPESYQKIEKYIPYVPNDQSRGHILLTSRNGSIWTDTLEIGKFKREESLHLIKSALPKETAKDVEKLAETLSDYPLGLTLAIGFIKSCPTATISKYLSLHMKRTLTNKEKDPNVVLDTYSNDAQTALLISLKSIEEAHTDALQTLFFMSLLNSKDIPESYIESWLKKTGSSLTADEAIKYIYDQSLVGVSETAEFHETKQIEKGQMTHYLSIHDLIHQLINEKLSVEEKKKLIDTATDVLLDVFAGDSGVFTKRIFREPIHLLHAQKLCENAEKIGYLNPKVLQLKICVGEILMGGVRDFAAAKPVLEGIEKDLKRGLQLDPYYKALFHINKGFFEAVHNINYDEAIRNMSEGVALLSPLKKYDEERLRALSNLAIYHSLIGEITRADNLIDQGKVIFKNSTSDVFNTFFIFSWAVILLDQGKFEDTIETLNKEKAYPNIITDLPTLYYAILRVKLEVLIKQRRLEEAQKAIEEYEKLLRSFFQERYEKSFEAPNVLFFKSLISIYKGENTEKAIQYLTENLKKHKEAFKSDKKHRRQARTHLVLGMAHSLNKDYTEAFKEYLLSEEIYNIVLKEKKIDDVSELYMAIALLGIDMKDDGLTHKYLKAHLNIFGHSHPRTQEILHTLDKHGLVIPF